MAQELGETREALSLQCWELVSSFAHGMRKEKKPFYIVYAAKNDPALQGANLDGSIAIGGIRQTVKAYYTRPPIILGVLVWFVDNNLGIMDFVPELSSPPDIPINPAMLSDKSEDQLIPVMEKGKKMKVLVS